MKTLMTIALFAMWQVSTKAQDLVPIESANGDESASVETSEAKITPANDELEWKPKFKVVLQLSEDGLITSGIRVVKMPITTYVARQQTIKDPFGNSSIASVKTPQQSYREVSMPYVVDPRAIIGCDDISVSASGDGKSADYILESTGRCVLFLTGMKIQADSMKLENSELILVNANVTKDQTEIKSTQMTIPLQVFGISTQKFNKALIELPPEPVIPPEGTLLQGGDSNFPDRRSFDDAPRPRTPVRDSAFGSDSFGPATPPFPAVQEEPEKTFRRSSFPST